MLNQQVFVLVHIFVSNVAASFAVVYFIICCSVFFLLYHISLVLWRLPEIFNNEEVDNELYRMCFILFIINGKCQDCPILIFSRIVVIAFGHPTKYSIVHVLGFWVVVKRRYNESKSNSRLEGVQYFNIWEFLSY